MGKTEDESSNIFLNILLNLPSLVLVIAEDGGVVFCNDRALVLFEGDTSCMTNNGLPVSYFKASDEITASVQNGNSQPFCVSSGNKIFQFSIARVKWLDGCERIVLSGTDITDLKKSEQKLILSAKTDGMTGILNRESTLLNLDRHIENIKKGYPGFSICYIDINDLKFINDTYGHSAGDKYILTIVSIIKNSVRKSDVFGRMGGDEFLVILPECKYQKIESIMNGVCARLEEINLSSGLFHKYSISYGISEIDHKSNLDRDNILNVIDTKMYYMKEEYKKSRSK